MDAIADTLVANPRGVNVIFDCVGTQRSFEQSIATVRRGGTIVNLAAWKEKPVVDMTFLLSKEVNIISTITLAVPREDTR